jgi:hypothetical protein
LRKLLAQYGITPAQVNPRADWFTAKDYPEHYRQALDNKPPQGLWYKTQRQLIVDYHDCTKNRNIYKPVKYLVVWDRLGSRYIEPSKGRFIRFYDQQVFTASAGGLVRLKDYKQYITQEHWETLDDRIEIEGDYYAESDNAEYVSGEYSGEVCYTDNAVYISDRDCYDTCEWVERNCYQASNGDWFYYEENRDEADGVNNREGLESFDCDVESVLGMGDADTCLVVNGEPLYLGVELELYCTKDRADLAAGANATGLMLAKEDGSLDESEGVELVTKPLSLSDQLEHWKGYLAKHGKNYDVYRGYGLHIHVSKNCLSRIEQARLSKFVCDKKHRAFMLDLSRRKSSSEIDQWANFENYNLQSRYFFPHKAGMYDLTKYCAVRLNKAHTIEFRFFAATTSLVELSTSLEFAQASVAYIAATRWQAAKDCLKLSHFFDYVRLHRETYPNLAEYMTGKLGQEERPLETVAA